MTNLKPQKRYNDNFPFFYREILSRFYVFRHAKVNRGLKTFVVFLGYPRSGHSIVGALLDAHPNITISHEVDALRLLKAGVSRRLLFGKILAKARWFHDQGSSWSGYSYRVPGQFQGCFESTRVIGDKKGGGTNAVLRQDMENIKLLDSLDLKIRIIHVMRNPFDNIVSRAQGGNLNNRIVTPARLNRAVDRHIEALQLVSRIKTMHKYPMLDLRMERLGQDPTTSLQELLEFVEVDWASEYLQACSSIVKPSSGKKRLQVQWPSALKRRVTETIAELEFLSGYSFDGDD
jgi:hypothetical protein